MNRKISLRDRLDYIHNIVVSLLKDELKPILNLHSNDGHTLLTMVIAVFAPIKDDKKIIELLQLCLPLVDNPTDSLR